jgi:adenylate cyclase
MAPGRCPTPQEVEQLARTSPPAESRLTQPNAFNSPAAEVALADAERKGFRRAMIGRACALASIAFFYMVVIAFPNNIYIPALILATAALGLASLRLVGSSHEHIVRFALFTFDAASVSALLALAPLSSGGDVPQNLVFLSGRTEYYYVILAISILALSPVLVVWTGLCAVIGLAGATAWIMAGMDRVISLGLLPPSATRDDVVAVMLDPDFLGISVRVIEGVVIALVTCIAALAVHRARNVIRAHAAGEAKRARMQRIFGRYVPAQVAEQIIDGGQLSPQQREASIMFVDIAGFTRLVEPLPPAQVIGLLNSFFGAATPIIEERGGVVVNHVGDALLASFNAPLPINTHSARAVDTARALLSLVAERDFEGHRVRVRIGIATGPVAAGTVGGAGRESYTLYGDTVNLAQRLEEFNKELGTACLISRATFEAARSDCPDAVSMGSAQVRGREGVIEFFAIGEKFEFAGGELNAIRAATPL